MKSNTLTQRLLLSIQINLVVSTALFQEILRISVRFLLRMSVSSSCMRCHEDRESRVDPRNKESGGTIRSDTGRRQQNVLVKCLPRNLLHSSFRRNFVSTKGKV